MKKIAILLSLLIFSSSAYAANISEGFRIGVAASKTEVNGSGSETLRSGSGADTTDQGQRSSTTTSEDTTIGHVFAEKTFSNGFTLGIDYVPGAADVGTKTRADDDEETTGDNKASAEVSEHLTFYGLMPIASSPLYVKGGIISMDVETNEKLATGSTYGNATVNGVTVGLGAHVEHDNGFFIRAEYSVSEYEEITLTSSGGNIVQADLDTTALKLAIGKSF
jgi:hypothetical protein